MKKLVSGDSYKVELLYMLTKMMDVRKYEIYFEYCPGYLTSE